MFEMEGKQFIFDVYKSNLYALDSLCYEVAKLCNGDDIQQVYKTVSAKVALKESEFTEIIDELSELGLIFEKDNMPKYISEFNPDIIPDDYPIYALALHVVHDCNLRCAYCYGEGGSYGGVRKPMSKEVAIRAIDFLLEQGKDQKEYSVIFFGGEPLMNFELIKVVTQYCKAKEQEKDIKIYLGMTTNGTLLTEEVLDFLDENDISVGVSIDGPQEVNDTCRKCVDGSGSFAKILPNIKEIIRRRDGRVTARVTLTKKHLNMYDIAQYMEELGFRKVNVALVSADEKSPLAIQKEDYQTISNEYKKIAEKTFQSIKNRERFFTNIFTSHLRILDNKNPLIFNCGAGRKYMAVSPEGDLYLCHRFAGENQYKMGNVYSGIIAERRKEVFRAHVDAREECSECWARYLCGGGCFYDSYEKGGDLMSAPEDYCDSYRDLYEITMCLYWKIKELNPEILETLFEEPGKNYFDLLDTGSAIDNIEE